MEKNKRRFFLSIYVQDIVAIPLAKFLIRKKINANYITLLGLFFAILSGISYLQNFYILGSILFFSALILDSTDGRVARGLNSFSKTGAILDSISDKLRSFFVAFCFVVSLSLDLLTSASALLLYVLLPVIRFIFASYDKNFYDPTILFWDGSIFRNWFIKKGILGFYTGWERAFLALSVAPLSNYKIEIFIFAVLTEQILFLIGLIFFRNSKIGI